MHFAQNLTPIIWINFFLIFSYNCTSGCPVYLTVALDGKIFEDSNLEINWGPECINKPQWVGLFTEDPSISNIQPAEALHEIKTVSGKFITNVKIGKLKFPFGWNKSDGKILNNWQPDHYRKGKCLEFYVASFNNTEILTVECLKIQPNWMGLLDHVAEIPLKHLFIPGSHMSGAYSDETIKTKSSLVKNYGYTQNIDVWAQLVFGIRFLDLNIGYLPNNYLNNSQDDINNFWIVNENMFITPLQLILDDIKRFVEQSNEIVIIDFSAFPIGFYKRPDRHSSLFQIIRNEIGHLAVERQSSSSNWNCDELSMNDIRKTGKYLILIYPLEELPYPDSESDLLCTIWKRFTIGNMSTKEALESMRTLFSKKPSSPVQDDGWIFHGFKGLEESLNTNSKPQTSRERAALINPKLLRWLNGPWSLTANVVTLDYFLSTNIIDTAIYANMHKAFTITNNNYLNIQIPN